MPGLLERTVPWPPEKSWNITGPSSGGGHTIYLSRGRIFHYYYGDDANCLEGEAILERAMGEFVAAAQYPKIIEELRAGGLVPIDG